MTGHGRKSKGLSPRRRHSALGIVSVLTLALILQNSEATAKAMSDGLALCVNRVIPTLFPFMVISELIVGSGAIRLPGRLLSAPFRRLFGISGQGGCAVLLGFLCGFPIGAKSALSLYRNGEIKQGELEHLLTFCNVPSSAFLISSVGVSLFQSSGFGLLLYAITLLSALLIGFFGGLLRRWKKEASASAEAMRDSFSSHGRRKGVAAFTEAVTASALSMLYVCAFVIFFSAFTGTLEHLLSSVSLPRTLSALCVGFFELTGGTARAALCSPRAAAYLCAVFAGWSGLSVHFQIMSLSDGMPISFRPYFLSKLLQSAMNAVLLWCFDTVFGLPI